MNWWNKPVLEVQAYGRDAYQEIVRLRGATSGEMARYALLPARRYSRQAGGRAIAILIRPTYYNWDDHVDRILADSPNLELLGLKLREIEPITTSSAFEQLPVANHNVWHTARPMHLRNETAFLQMLNSFQVDFQADGR